MDKIYICKIFLYEFELGYSVVTANHNINHVFGDGTANECTAQLWFRKFCSVDTSPENKPQSCSQTGIKEQELKALVEADTCQTMKEFGDRLIVNFSTVSQHLEAIGKGMHNKFGPYFC
ncbi:histone-lysine N-methyltransferase SETMAR-like [Tachypleus tridentatus]|uniref:histone-lysine N-methyltransferase SETMAR-like n=1 Tax=Tachypleus tridentatus TaxID=6853 RepID=UPI003FD50F68